MSGQKWPSLSRIFLSAHFFAPIRGIPEFLRTCTHSLRHKFSRSSNRESLLLASAPRRKCGRGGSVMDGVDDSEGDFEFAGGAEPCGDSEFPGAAESAGVTVNVGGVGGELLVMEWESCSIRTGTCPSSRTFITWRRINKPRTFPSCVTTGIAEWQSERNRCLTLEIGASSSTDST